MSLNILHWWDEGIEFISSVYRVSGLSCPKAENLVNQLVLIHTFFACLSYSCYSELSVAESLSGADKTMAALVTHTDWSWEFLNEIIKYFARKSHPPAFIYLVNDKYAERG